MKRNKDRRQSWDEYFMAIAEIVAKRSTCLRRQVGVVIVKDKKILTTGYNGAPSGIVHCEEVGCLRGKMGIASGERHELCRGVHAEQNAVIQAANFGLSIQGATIYTTHQPCFICSKILINACIKKIVFKQAYRDKLAIQMLKQTRIKYSKLK